MSEEELIKSQFPNDEFLQSAVLQIVNKCVYNLEDYFPYLNRYEAYILNQEVAKAE